MTIKVPNGFVDAEVLILNIRDVSRRRSEECEERQSGAGAVAGVLARGVREPRAAPRRRLGLGRGLRLLHDPCRQ